MPLDSGLRSRLYDFDMDANHDMPFANCGESRTVAIVLVLKQRKKHTEWQTACLRWLHLWTGATRTRKTEQRLMVITFGLPVIRPVL